METVTKTTAIEENISGNGRSPQHCNSNESTPVNSVFTEEMLARENRFFEEDFEELRAAKYLLIPLPAKFGGAGMSLAEVCREQRRLAYHAPATALALNMHLYWVGVAADLWRRGDSSLEWILKDAAAGEVFAAGHAESGNRGTFALTPSPTLDQLREAIQRLKEPERRFILRRLHELGHPAVPRAAVARDAGS